MVDRLATEIRINPQTHNLFTIVYRNTSSRLAYDVVQTILNTFVESKTDNNRSEMENAQLFLQQQIDSYEKQLREAEKKRADFRARYIDLLPTEGASGGTGLEAARASVRTLQGQLQDALAKREMLTKALKATPTLLVTETEGSTRGHSNTRLREAERQLTEMRLRYTERHPDVIAQRQLVDTLKASGKTDPDPVPAGAAPRNRSLPNPVYEQLKVRVVENDSTIASLQRQITDVTRERDQLEAIARGAPGLQAEYTNIDRDYDVLRKNYEELLARRESMRIATAAEADADKVKMQIIDPPRVPQNPVAPKRALLLSGVLAVGLAGGIGLALLLVQFDYSFHSIDELRGLGLPVVGGISMLGPVASFRQRMIPAVTCSSALLLLCAVYGGLLWRMLHAAGAA
jgi:polysaccharide chain length determinant protein (PEP-CTERM system associated)